MPRLYRSLIVLLMVFAPWPVLAGPADDAGALVDRWEKAYNAHDIAALVAMYVPDAILFSSETPTIIEGREAIRAYFTFRLPGGGNKVTLGERRTFTINEQAAVVVGFYDFTWMRVNGTFASPARFTMVLVKRGDDWFILHHHSSKRPPRDGAGQGE